MIDLTTPGEKGGTITDKNKFTLKRMVARWIESFLYINISTVCLSLT